MVYSVTPPAGTPARGPQRTRQQTTRACRSSPASAGVSTARVCYP